MRILHIAALVTADNAYGGPTTVATAQVKELARRGHDVDLIAGSPRSSRSHPPWAPDQLQLFPAYRVLPQAGFAGLTSPRLLTWARRTANTYDVAHIHVARDLLTLPAAAALARANVPVVLQPHGMIDRSRRPLAHVLDSLLTRRVLDQAAKVFYLTANEHEELLHVGTPPSKLFELENGIEPSNLRADLESKEVLFLARLAQRKRPQVFIEMAEVLAQRYKDWTFALVGQPEDQAGLVESLLSKSKFRDRIRYEGNLEPHLVRRRMAKSSVYVLPAINEPFPMSVLEAISVGLPTVVTDTCGLSSAVATHKLGLVSSAQTASLVNTVESLILEPARRWELGANAITYGPSLFGMEAVGARLEHLYRDAIRH